MISLVRRLVRKKVMKCVLLLFIRAFIYFWLHWVSVALPELSPVEASGDSSSWRPSDFSLQWLSLLRSVGPGRLDFSRCSTGPLGAALGLCSAGSVVVVHGLVVRGMWDLPRSGVGPCTGSGFCATREVQYCSAFFYSTFICQMFIEHVAYLPGNSLELEDTQQ